MVDKERDFEGVLCGHGDEEVEGRVSVAGPCKPEIAAVYNVVSNF
jgi:hypothetical protein